MLAYVMGDAFGALDRPLSEAGGTDPTIASAEPTSFALIEGGPTAQSIAVTAPTVITGPAPYVGIGRFISSLGDVNNDGIDDFLIGAAFQGPGGGYVVYGQVGGIGSINLGTLSATQGFRIDGDAFAHGGPYMVGSSAGDLNGDGYDDIIIGAQYVDTPFSFTGRAYVVYGHATSGAVDLANMSAGQGTTLLAPSVSANFGAAVASAGDVNGDGYDDVLIGSPSFALGNQTVGRAYLLFGSASGIPSNLALGSMTPAQGITFTGIPGASAGGDVAGLGDVNGDGIDDFAIGASLENNGVGSVYVYFGKISGLTSQTLTTPAAADGFVIRGMSPSVNTGFTIAQAGDVNGDGYADLILSQGYGNSAAADYVIFGHVGGFGTVDLGSLSPSQGVKISWPSGSSGDTYVARAGDVDGDGYDDLLIGGSLSQFQVQGVVYVIPGAAAFGPVDLATFTGVALTVPDPSDQNARNTFWTVLDGLGDINGDGLADIGVGTAGGPNFEGKADIYYGVEATSPVTRTGTVASQTLVGGTGNDFLYGMGGNDALWGHAGNDTLDGGTGIDLMHGGAGDDTYIVDNVGDRVFENAAEGTDTIQSSVSYSLADAPNVEQLVLTGTGNIDGTGSAGNDTMIGNAGNNAFVGGLGNDLINISQGGSDSASGGQGDDNFYLGGAFDASDTVDGGAGTLDSLGLQGVYAGLTLGANSLTGVELVALMSGTNTRFVDLGGALMSYNLTLNDGNVAAGEKLVFQANALRAGEDFTLNAAAETNGHIQTFAGFGTETITGGQLDDGFYFGAGRFGANDRVDGQGGFDSLGLQGDFSGTNALTFGALQIVNIEIIALLSGSNTRFGNFNSLFSYSLTMNDANLAAGASMIVQGNALQAGEALVFDGSAETDGRFRIFGGAGNDSLTGGQTGDQITAGDGNDILVGLGGADQLTGAAGNDTFRYLAIGDSTAAASDQIRDFTTGDLIDLSALDANIAAGQQQFSFIGANAFTAAGQLRVTQTGGSALVEGDVNGDGIADFAISVTVSDSHQLALADFIGVGAGGGQSGGASALDALLDSLPGHAALSSDPGAAAVGLYEHRVNDIGHAAFAPVLSAMPLETFL